MIYTGKKKVESPQEISNQLTFDMGFVVGAFRGVNSRPFFLDRMLWHRIVVGSMVIDFTIVKSVDEQKQQIG